MFTPLSLRWLPVLFACLCSLSFAAAHRIPPMAENSVTLEERAAFARGNWVAWDRAAWLREAKFGLFIHWGPYSIAGGVWKGNSLDYGEWLQQEAKIPNEVYERELSSHFNPQRFDPSIWMRAARGAGMRYVVFTTKHHDGFCLFDSAATNYDVVDFTEYGKDIVKQVADAARAEGLIFCPYYSIADWHHPDAPAQYQQGGFHGAPNPNADIRVYAEYMNAQVGELVKNYGQIGSVWFDDGGAFRNGPTKLGALERLQLLRPDLIAATIRQAQPWALINNRLGYDSDYGTPEQTIPQYGYAPGILWESCMTMSRKWCYTSENPEWKSSATMIQLLGEIVSKGGFLLLNVGPTGDGEFPTEALQRLAEIGQWMEVNHEAIYGTQASPFEQRFPWGFCTRKGNALYVMVKEKPDEKIELPLSKRVRAVSVLGQPQAQVHAELSGEVIQVHPDGVSWDPALTVIKVEF